MIDSLVFYSVSLGEYKIHLNGSTYVPTSNEPSKFYVSIVLLSVLSSFSISYAFFYTYSLYLFLIISLTLTHSDSDYHSLSLSLALIPFYSLWLPVTLDSHSLPWEHSLSHICSKYHSLSLILSFSHFKYRSATHYQFDYHTCAPSLTLTHSHSLANLYSQLGKKNVCSLSVAQKSMNDEVFLFQKRIFIDIFS